MTLHRIKGKIEFECDTCQEILASETADFHEAIEKLRSEGWTALPPLDKAHGDWRHRCNNCRFPRSYGED